jgi:condensin complex subunit 3
MAQREEALGRGLRDREEGVKRAAKKLAGRWAEGVQAGMGEDGLALPEVSLARLPILSAPLTTIVAVYQAV